MSVRFITASLIQSSAFYARTSGSESGSFVSSSFYYGSTKELGEIKGDFDKNNITFTLTSQSFGGNNDVKALVVSASQDRPFIGIGTDNPKSTFDVKDVQNSALGTRFLLKSTRTTTEGAQVGDSAGSINFAIDSASYNDVFTSGSVASIDSRVRSIDDTGDGTSNVAGNIIFKSSPEWIETLNEISEIGYFHFDNLNPTEDSEPGMIINGQLTVGSGSMWQSQGGDVAFSVHNVDEPNMSPGNNLLKFRIKGSNAIIHSGSLTIGSGSLFLGETYSGTNQVEFVNLRGQSPIKIGHISGGSGNHGLEIYTANTLAAKFDNSQNLGIGTSQNTAPEKLTVQGNISSSGTIVGSNLSGTNTGDQDLSSYIQNSQTSSMSVATASLANEITFTNITGKPTLISSSGQVDHDATTNFVASEHFTQANITTVGTVTSGDVSAILPTGILSGSAQIASDISGAFDSVSASLAADIPTNNNQLTNGAGYTTNTGTVDTTGTPANNQLAIFTDSNTIEGDADLTYNGSTLELAGRANLDNIMIDNENSGGAFSTSGDYGFGSQIYLGASVTTLTSGKAYYLTSTDAWSLASTGSEAAVSGLLGVRTSTGTNSISGMLLNGIVRTGTSGTVGQKVYLADAGTLTTTKPTTSGHFVRIVGYIVANSTVYFTPSNDYIKLS